MARRSRSERGTDRLTRKGSASAFEGQAVTAVPAGDRKRSRSDERARLPRARGTPRLARLLRNLVNATRPRRRVGSERDRLHAGWCEGGPVVEMAPPSIL